jgi:cytochrome c-type biogenesis protein CcmH/NrfG
MSNIAEQDLQPAEEQQPASRKWIIILVVALVLCCLCLAVAGGAYWLWINGDQLLGLGRLA